MERNCIWGLTIPFVLLVGSADGAERQMVAEQLAGTWSLVSNSAVPGNAAMRGIKIVHADGRFALIMTRPDSELAVATAARIGNEDVSPPAGGIVEAAFGTYSLDPAAGAITFHVDANTFPNWEGMERRRDFKLEGDRWSYSGPLPDGSGAREFVWQRLQ